MNTHTEVRKIILFKCVYSFLYDNAITELRVNII